MLFMRKIGRVCLLRPGLLAWKMYWLKRRTSHEQSSTSVHCSSSKQSMHHAKMEASDESGGKHGSK